MHLHGWWEKGWDIIVAQHDKLLSALSLAHSIKSICQSVTHSVSFYLFTHSLIHSHNIKLLNKHIGFQKRLTSLHANVQASRQSYKLARKLPSFHATYKFPGKRTSSQENVQAPRKTYKLPGKLTSSQKKTSVQKNVQASRKTTKLTSYCTAYMRKLWIFLNSYRFPWGIV